MGTDAEALTPLVTGGGVFAVLVTVIVYLLIQNGRLTKRLSEVQSETAAADRVRITELEGRLARVANPGDAKAAERQRRRPE